MSTNDHHPQPGHSNGLLVALGAACLLTVLAEFLVDRHSKIEIAGVFGFYAWYAFAAGVALVAVARGAQYLLARRADYYGGED